MSTTIGTPTPPPTTPPSAPVAPAPPVGRTLAAGPPAYNTGRRRRPGISTPTSRGQHCIDWIERYCVCTIGHWTGQPLVLLPWQKRFIWLLFELGPDALRR